MLLSTEATKGRGATEPFIFHEQLLFVTLITDVTPLVTQSVQ